MCCLIFNCVSFIHDSSMSPKLSNKHKDTQLSSKEEQFPLASTGDAPHLFHSVSASASNDYKAAGFCCQSVKLVCIVFFCIVMLIYCVTTTCMYF